jgi:NitT/TauT family transport system substrate-binding protein
MKRPLLAALLAPLFVLLLLPAAGAQAQTKLVFGTNWYAQAEHGGYYQALAEGIYRKHGLEVEIRMGGPQVNVLQLLLAGQMDVVMGDDLQTLKAVEGGLPLVTIGTTFQRDPIALIAHPGVSRIEDLKTRTIFVGQASESTYWPWLKSKYGFSDAQKKRYQFSVQPFLVDRNSATQGYVTSEPFTIEKGGVKPVVFLLGNAGYPPYGQTLVTTRNAVVKNGDALQRFLQASAEGWKSYLADPAPGNALILKDNPQIGRDLLAFGLAKLREYELVTGGDAKTRGILTINAARWQQTRDFMVESKLLKPEIDYTQAFTTQLIDQVKVLP